MTNYEKELNHLKERILKDGDTLVSKRDLLERFCEVDEAYNGCPWNLLQILTNIHILIGEEPCEDAISKASVFEIMGNLMSIPYDLDRPINKKDVSDSMGEIRALPPVTPTRKKGQKMDKIRFVQLTYTNGEKTYIKADTIVQLEEVGNDTYVYTIGNDSPLYVKESVDEILAKIGGEE